MESQKQCQLQTNFENPPDTSYMYGGRVGERDKQRNPTAEQPSGEEDMSASTEMVLVNNLDVAVENESWLHEY